MNKDNSLYIILIGSDGLSDYINPSKIIKDLVKKVNSKLS
jgi:hypothetical protein